MTNDRLLDFCFVFAVYAHKGVCSALPVLQNLTKPSTGLFHKKIKSSISFTMP